MHESRLLLHVDDDAAMLRVVRNALSVHGYEVFSCSDPTAAQGILLRENIRACLLDVEMPGLNGLQLLQQIKQVDGGIQVLMLTGLVSMSTVLESLTHGAEGVFFKPVDDYQPLVEALDDAFRKIDRWWNSLHELRRRRTNVQRELATQ